MPEYVGFKKKKSRLGTTLLIVAGLHVAGAGGLVWLASTSLGQEFLEIYKVKIRGVQEKKPEPAKPPAPEPPKPEAPPPPAPEALPPQVEAPAPQEEAVAAAPVSPEPAPDSANEPVRLPGFGNPFASAGAPGRKFSGYIDLLTSELQRLYHQPPDLADHIALAALFQLQIDDQGRLLNYKLMGSSGNKEFDQSALQAIAQLKQVRPPPPGMSHEIVVKFIPPPTS